jgi:formylglycine-generating enzyme required for sulfatase activity
MNNIPMVLVPESGFRMGSDDSVENVKPEMVIYLLSYYIDKYEVTNGIYQPCVDAGVCQPPKSSASQTRSAYYDDPQYKDYPVINVDWQMAKNFCEWRGARLPTEAEWEKASRGTDARVYPWGDGMGCSFANYRDGSTLCVGDTSQVGQYENGKSIYGVFDMSGNVLEWVSSLYFSYPYNSLDGREDLSTAGKHILRGGSWQFTADGISAFYRLSVDPSQYAVAGNDVGFRCAREANP